MGADDDAGAAAGQFPARCRSGRESGCYALFVSEYCELFAAVYSDGEEDVEAAYAR